VVVNWANLAGLAQAAPDAPGDRDTTFYIAGLVQQSDGSLFAAGSSLVSANSDFALARYTANDALETAFGVGGKITVDFGSDDSAFATDRTAMARSSRPAAPGSCSRWRRCSPMVCTIRISTTQEKLLRKRSLWS